MSTAVPRRLVRAVVATISFAVTVAGLSITHGTSSSAASAGRLHVGKGYAVADGDFVGFYAAPHGVKVYCLSPRKALPATITLASVMRYPGISKAASHELAYALRRWGNARSAHAAAIESQLLNTVVGNRADVRRRARQLPKSIGSALRRHLALTRRFYGPYITTVHTPKAILPGQSSAGSVTITSASGHRLTRATVLLSSGGNGSVPRRIKTDGNGIGRFTYRATDVGEVHIRATAGGLPPTAVRVNRPKPWEQRMVTWSRAVTSHGSAGFQRSPSGFANSYACTTTCDGKPRTTVTACAPPSSYASRIGYHYEGRAAYIAFPRSTKWACKNLTVTMKDADHVWAGWQYKTPHGWSKVLVAKGSFDVDCPAVPAVAVTMSYDCTKASVSISLAKLDVHGSWMPLVNSTRHRMVLVIGGQRRVYAGRGERATFTAAVSCDSPSTYTMQAGVQRSNGHYNYGSVASVTTPANPTVRVAVTG